ncbi:MAG: MGMT family protein [Planctomycetota bacterium]|nr:MGMT family protein [Planctomycetota bacterium]
MEPNPYLDALRRVAAGRTASFAELARLAGRPAAARAAGRAVAAVPSDDPRPWHRIVHSDGALAPDPDRAAVQLERLRAEGARPRADEEIRAWARRRRARFVGSWRSRALYDCDDERLGALDPLRVEVLRDAEQTLERGFYFAPAPPLSRAPDPKARQTTAKPRPARNAVPRPDGPGRSPGGTRRTSR